MKIPCKSFSRCIDPAEPTANFSSEDEDINHSFCYGQGNGSTLPDPGLNWDTQNCEVIWGTIVCTAANDDDCQVCVQNKRVECNPDHDDNKPPPPPDVIQDGEPRYTWPNIPTSCTSKCPDGTEFQYFVPFAKFFAATTYMANLLAYRYACKLAKAHRICLGSMTGTQGCLGESFLCNVSATGKYSGPNNYWQIVAGELPPGTALGAPSGDGATIGISGTPTASGTYTFTLRVTTYTGDYMQKVFTICVVGISPDTLPDGTVGVDYNETLTAPSCATPVLRWEVASGNLPNGLTLDPDTGKLSGTPTVGGNFTFTVRVLTDSLHVP